MKERSSPVTSTASWCWFSSPRAIAPSSSNSIVFGYVRSNGDITIQRHDITRDQSTQHVLASLGVDDHNHPTVSEVAPGRLLIVYSGHNRDNQLRLRTAAPDLSWISEESVLTSDRGVVTYSQVHTYEDHIVLFYRVAPRVPTDKPRLWACRVSNDLGESWSDEMLLFDFGPRQQGYIRSVQVNDQPGIIDVALSAHPAHGPPVDLFFCQLDFRRTSPSTLSIPANSDREVRPGLTSVYSATASGQRPWVWDITANNASCHILFTTYEDSGTHTYRYAKVDHGSRAVTTVKLFEMSQGIADERERYYSGGLAFLDDGRGQNAVASIFDRGRWVLEWWQLDIQGLRSRTRLPTAPGAMRPQPVSFEDRTAILYLTGNYRFYKEFETQLELSLIDTASSRLSRMSDLTG